MVAALSGAPGPALAAAFDTAVHASSPSSSPSRVPGRGLWAQTARVVSAGRRLSGWVTYGHLRYVAALVQAWQADPPVPLVQPGLVTDDDRAADDAEDAEAIPAAGDAALVERLEEAASRCERRVFGLFGYQGTARQWAQDIADVLVASELAVAGGLSPTTARAWVNAAVAIFVEDRLPGLARLLEAGWVDWAKVNLFVRETSHLDAPVARAVDAVVLGPVGDDSAALASLDVLDVLADPALPGTGVPVIARWTLPQLKDAIRAAILELKAAEAAARSKERRRRRHVRVEEDVDGTAELVANLPAEAAAAVFASLTMAAKAAKAAGDPRTLDQLRADELVHRATRGVTPAEYQSATHTSDSHSGPGADSGADYDSVPTADPDTDRNGAPGADSGTGSADSGADPDALSTADPDTPSGADPGAPSDADPDADSHAVSDAGEQGRSLPADVARCACGRAVPVAFVPSFTAAHAGEPTKSTLVSLTMPLSTFLGLGDQPGRLDGHGPVAAGLARRIAEDAAKEQPTWTAWRCIVTDDTHGTVLGVTDPIWTPRHDPPPRLARLVTAMGPVCAFPGCRQPAHVARCCDLDHRIRYDPDDPTGEHGGGRTCSCNLGALCRAHHRQKTLGALKVRAIGAAEDPAAPAGTLAWTLPSGVTCRSHPHVAAPAPIPTSGPGVHPDVAAAAAHVAAERAREEALLAELANHRNLDDEIAATDWAGDGWRRSRAEAAQARADAARVRAEQAARDAEREARANEPPPF